MASGAARRDTPRNGTGRAESAEPGRDPHLTHARTRTCAAHTRRRGAQRVVATDRGTERRGEHRRAFTRIESESGCRTNGRSVGCGMSGEEGQ